MGKDPFALQPPGAPQAPQAMNYMPKIGQQAMEMSDVRGDYIDNGKPHRPLSDLAPVQGGQMQPGQQIQTMGATDRVNPKRGLMPGGMPAASPPPMGGSVQGMGVQAQRGLMPRPMPPQRMERQQIIDTIKAARQQAMQGRRMGSVL